MSFLFFMCKDGGVDRPPLDTSVSGSWTTSRATPHSPEGERERREGS